MKKAVIYFWNNVMKKEATYRIEKFDLHAREDLEGLANTGTLAQKQYPFPIMEKPELSCRMFVDHAGVNYWKVREQVRAAMLYFGMEAKEAAEVLLKTTLGKQCVLQKNLLLNFGDGKLKQKYMEKKNEIYRMVYPFGPTRYEKL